MKENLFDLDLQYFADEDAGENEALEPAEQVEDEVAEEETGEEETGAAEPEQSAEENARYAAIRRRAEEEAKKKYDSQLSTLDQEIAAMCKGITHPITNQPITNVRDYMDALKIQQRQEYESELQNKGVDPSLIERMIESNPVVMQAQQVIEKAKMDEAEAALQKDLEEIRRYDPSIKGMNDLANLPSFQDMVDRVNKGASLIDAYKMANFDAFMQHTNEAARQQAINQMRGKDHLASQTGLNQKEDFVEVPVEIMNRWKSEGKTEKQIRSLYKTVASKLNI